MFPFSRSLRGPKVIEPVFKAVFFSRKCWSGQLYIWASGASMIFQSSGLGENFSIFGASFVFLFYDLQSISNGASLNLPSWTSNGSKSFYPGYGLFKKQFSRLPILENLTFWMPYFLMVPYFISSGISLVWISISCLSFCASSWACIYFSMAFCFHVLREVSRLLPLLCCSMSARFFCSFSIYFAFSKSLVSFRDL